MLMNVLGFSQEQFCLCEAVSQVFSTSSQRTPQYLFLSFKSVNMLHVSSLCPQPPSKNCILLKS